MPPSPSSTAASTGVLSGVFAAVVTPLHEDYSPDCNAIPALLGFLASRGCHGALLLGTTGEGPSFSPEQRIEILRAALEVRRKFPSFRLLAGTGTPSLDETIRLTRAAFDLGIDGVLALPPYFYRKASTQGLFDWYARVIDQAVPMDGALLGYHIPGVSGVPLPLELLTLLAGHYPRRFAGIKDSSGDAEHARLLGRAFGSELKIFTGNDRLFSLALEQRACGCITAAANLVSPLLRQVWDAFQEGSPDGQAQRRLDSVRLVMDRYPPAPPLLKAALNRLYGLPAWPACPPLRPADPAGIEELVAAVRAALPGE